MKRWSPLLGAVIGGVVAGAVALALAGADLDKLGDWRGGPARFIGMLTALGLFAGYFVTARVVRGRPVTRDGFTLSLSAALPARADDRAGEVERELDNLVLGEGLGVPTEGRKPPRMVIAEDVVSEMGMGVQAAQITKQGVLRKAARNLTDCTRPERSRYEHRRTTRASRDQAAVVGTDLRAVSRSVRLVEIMRVELRSPEIKTARVVGHGPTHDAAFEPIRDLDVRYPRFAIRFTGICSEPLIRPSLVIDDETLELLRS